MKKLTFLIIALSTFFTHASANQSKHKVGVIISYYKYIEPNVMNTKGFISGFDYIYDTNTTAPLSFMLWAKFVAGSLKYNSNGTGSMSNDKNYYVDIKPIAKFKLLLQNLSSFSPYIGIGFRYLANPYSGRSSTGHYSYDRTNKMLYVPVGIFYEHHFHEHNYLETQIEGSLLIYGRQFSDHHEPHTVTQKKGYGFRIASEYNTEKWSIGPYFQYWNIDDSTIFPSSKGGYWVEPKNNTIEYGLTLRFKF